MTDRLAIITARMLRDHFEKNDMKDEVAELDAALKGQEFKKPEKSETENEAETEHNEEMKEEARETSYD